MSTNINISVGDNKLLEQARLQQAASRQAQLEREANQRLEAQATAERIKANAAQGKDANGNPLYGVPAAKPDIDRRPAANRQDQTKVGHVWRRSDSALDFPIYQGLVISGGGNSITEGASFPSVEGQIENSIYSGKVSANAALPSFSYSMPPPSTLGYTWSPTYDAYYYNFAWFPYAYGPRTARWYTEDSKVMLLLPLPAGKDTFVLLIFYYEITCSVDITAPHYATASPVSGNPFSPPSDLPSRFTAKVTPGASVDIGFYVDINGNPTHSYDPPSTSIFQETNHANLAFVCSNTGIKQITPSAKLLEFMQWMNPPLGTTAISIKLNNFNDDVTANIPISENKFSALSSSTLSSGFVGNGPVKRTPQIYKAINDIYPYALSSSIIDYQQIESRLSTDTRTGAYGQTSSVSGLFSSLLPLVYAKIIKTRPLSELGKKVFSLLLDPARPAVQAQINALFAVWDWDNPGYCKARLADLGISASDLTP